MTTRMDFQTHTARHANSAAIGRFGAIAAPAPLGILEQAMDGLVTVVETLLAWQDRANQRHQLAQLDDRALTDIGVSRGAAMAEANKPFWQA